MKNKVVIAGIIILAIGLGYAAGWMQFVKYPQVKVAREAKQQQELMQSMTRHGEIIKLSDNSVTVKVAKSGGEDKGNTVKYHMNDFSNIQIGMSYVGQPGQKLNLSEYFKTGDYVDLLVKEGQVVLIHRDLHIGETAITTQEQQQ